MFVIQRACFIRCPQCNPQRLNILHRKCPKALGSSHEYKLDDSGRDSPRARLVSRGGELNVALLPINSNGDIGGHSENCVAWLGCPAKGRRTQTSDFAPGVGEMSCERTNPNVAADVRPSVVRQLERQPVRQIRTHHLRAHQVPTHSRHSEPDPHVLRRIPIEDRRRQHDLSAGARDGAADPGRGRA